MATATRVEGVFMEQPATHRMSRQRRILMLLFVASFALDFRGDAGGSPIQVMMAGLNSVAFLLLALSYRMTLPGKGLAAFVFWGWGIFLLVGTLGAGVNATPAEQYIRVVYPFALFLEGFLVVWWTAKDPRDAGRVVSAMMATAVVSLCYTCWRAFHFMDLMVEEMRTEIASPLIPVIITTAGYDLIFAGRQRLWASLLLAIVFGIIVLSATRGLILIVGFVAGFVMLTALWNCIRTGRFPGPVVRAVVLGGILTSAGSTIAVLFNPDVFGRWEERIFGTINDVSFWTRIAAIVGQFETLMADPMSWWIGEGFGSSYPWPVSIFPWIVRYLAVDTIDRSVWFPGEFMWMPFLFYGGFIIGPVAASVLLAGAARTFRLVSNLMGNQLWRYSEARPLWVGAFGYFAFLGMGFTANPFILRLAALFMGLCLGLVLVQGSLVQSAFISAKSSLIRHRKIGFRVS